MVQYVYTRTENLVERVSWVAFFFLNFVIVGYSTADINVTPWPSMAALGIRKNNLCDSILATTIPICIRLRGPIGIQMCSFKCSSILKRCVGLGNFIPLIAYTNIK
jgi:hypothetical protein